MQYYFLIIGCIFVLSGFVILYKRMRLAICGTVVVGKITRITRRSALDRNRTASYALVEYKSTSGELFSFEEGLFGFKKNMGRSVEVVFLPGQPEKAIVKSLRTIFVPGLAFFILGGGALIAFFKIASET